MYPFASLLDNGKNSKWQNSAVLFTSQNSPFRYRSTGRITRITLYNYCAALCFHISIQLRVFGFRLSSFNPATFRYSSTLTPNTPFVRPIFSRLAKSAFFTAFNMIDGLMGTRDRDTTSVFFLN